MNYEYFLVKLPRIKDLDKDFYSIGYFAENGDFIFSVLTPEIFFPVRSISPQKWNENEYDSQKPEIIGKIEGLI